MDTKTRTIGWVGTATSIIGSFTVSFHFFLLGYILFLAGSISWLYIGKIRRDKPLMVLNAAFLVANMIGLYNAAI